MSIYYINIYVDMNTLCRSIYIPTITCPAHICMSVFRTDHLVLGYPLVCSSLGKLRSPVASFPQLPINFHLGLRPRDFPISFAISSNILIVQFTFR